MKKAAALAIALSMILSFSACQKKQSSDDAVSARGPVTSVGISADDNDGSSPETANDAPSVPLRINPNVQTLDDTEEESVSSQKPKKEIGNKNSESETESKTESQKEASGGTSDEIAENGTYTYEGVTIDLPAGYKIQSNNDNVITTVPADFPYTNQNVTFSMSEGNTAHITEEQVNSMYKDMFEGFTGCKEFVEYTIDGYNAQYFSYDVSMSDISLNMAQVALYLDNKAVIITFTSEVSADFSVLKKAADSVRVE